MDRRFRERSFMNVNLIEGKVSADPKWICFPYVWKKSSEHEQDLFFEDVRNSGIAATGKDYEDIADIKVYAVIKPQRGYISSHFKTVVTSVDGSTYAKRRLAELPEADAYKVLNAFFAVGAPGMDKAYSTLFHNFFNEYLSR